MPPVGWTKYKEIPIAGFSGDQTDLNYIAIVTYESNMKSDFSDIRFVDSDDETLLDQHRESYTSETTSLWIIQVDVPAAGKTIRAYYGNASASLKDDEANTFPFYDAFTGDDDDPPDDTKWTISDATYVKISSNTLHIYNNWGYLDMYAYGKTSFGPGYALRFRIRSNNYWQRKYGWGVTYTGIRYYFWDDLGACKWYYLAINEAASDLHETDYHILMIKMIDAELKRYYFDDDLEYSRDTNTEADDQIPVFFIDASNPGDHIYIDWVYVLKLPQDGTEPAALELGEEQDVANQKMSGKDGYVLYGATLTITDASHSAGTVTVTSAGHGLSVKDRIIIENIVGMTDLNIGHSVIAVSTNTFDVLLTTEQFYISGGTARRMVEVTGWVLNIDTIMVEITDSGDEGWRTYMSKWRNWYGIFRGLLWTSTKYPTLYTEVSLKLIADSDTTWEGPALIDFENERVPVPDAEATLFEFGFTGTGTLV